MRENIIKIYWQTIDSFGKLETYTDNKPKAYTDYQGRTKFDATSSKYLGGFHLFPMVLKPLQIAEIKVNENGTWSYEIEREEGWYMAKGRSGAEYLVLYKNGEYTHYQCKERIDISLYTISSTRIPDECII